MAQYRKKPVVVDAEQWYPSKEVEGCVYPAPDKPASLIGEYGFCATAEGGLYVTPGDWILKGYSKDLGVHYWVNKPDYFNENYEAVKSPDVFQEPDSVKNLPHSNEVGGVNLKP